MTRIVWFKALIVGLLVLLAPMALAQERRPHSILVLDQSDGGPFYQQMLSGLRNSVSSHMDAHVTLYNESLDLNRFKGDAFKANLKRYVREKYQDKAIGVVVAIGAGAAGLVLNWRDELWPGIPIVFDMLDEMDVARLKPPRDVTGVIVQVPRTDSTKFARHVMPDLDNIALVGDAWDQLIVFRNWKDEIATAAAGLQVIEIIGQTMTDIRRRVAELPERSAIIYSSIFSDG